MRLKLTPSTVKAACVFVAHNHRHNGAPQGGLFAVGVERGGALVGVAIAGRPVARMLADGKTVEITRCCTTGEKNACSMLYGALCRAATALGYAKVITYTLASEDGASLRAAGFVVEATVKGEVSWSRPSRKRTQEKRPAEDKFRWSRTLKGD